jgi:hypothetical protein
MPKSKDKNDKYHDIAFPLKTEFREAIQNAILDKYAQEKGIEREERQPLLNVVITENKKKTVQQPEKEVSAASKSKTGVALEGTEREDRKPSLNVKITEGKKKAVGQPKKEVPAIAKSKTGVAL